MENRGDVEMSVDRPTGGFIPIVPRSNVIKHRPISGINVVSISDILSHTNPKKLNHTRHISDRI